MTPPQVAPQGRWKTLDQVIGFFWGDFDRWPMTSEDGRTWTQPEILAVARHILKTGDCLWHAQSVVMVLTECPCAKCVRAGR